VFNEKGYLINFSLPIRVVQRILDLAAEAVRFRMDAFEQFWRS